jgi:hypothetical protein
MCMDSKAALLVMNLGVQRGENEQRVSTARASSERRDEHPAGIRRPLRADMYRAIGGNVVLSWKGQRYRAKGIVAETSKLMQCECALYEGECEKKQGPHPHTLDESIGRGTWRMPRSFRPYCVTA